MTEKGILNEDIEAILDNADREFREGQEEAETIEEFGDTPSKRGKIQEYQDILLALGFIRYDNKGKGIAYKLHVGSLQIGRTFTEKTPVGTMWVKCLVDCEHGKKGEFLKRGQLNQIPQVALFYLIRDGKLSIPGQNVIGEIVGKSEKAIQVVFDEFEESRTEWWGLGALKRGEDGVNFIPASFSKETESYAAKMQVPRDILLLNYEEELGKAPLAVSGSDDGHKEQATEKVERSTMVEAIHPKGAVPPVEKGKLTVDYYVQLIGEITEKVKAEERISKGEWGYAINMVFHAYSKDTRTTLIAELKNGAKGNETKH